VRGDATALELAEAVVGVLSGRTGGAAALATVVGRSGSAPQVLGARLLLHEDGRFIGTVGGGAIEQQVLEACRATLKSGSPQTVKAHLVRDLGMCCGGSMEVFVEFVQAETRLIVVGAGHVAQALAPIVRSLGFRVLIVDDREELLGHPAFAGLPTAAYDADELADAIPDPSERDFVVIVSRDHQRDEQALATLLPRPHAYLGMIGSRRKVHAILGRVLRRYDERGRPRPDLGRLRAPIGLSLGGRTPAEIAVSIAAELVAAQRGGDGRPMSIAEQAAARIGAVEDKAS
jgi:xanthine dehydrogenase accessory factor